MNRGDFIRIMHDTGSVDQQIIGEVRGLLDQFPYFQSAHLLLLKGLHNTSDVSFESQLRESAIFIADREVLYYLLKSKSPAEEEHSEKSNISVSSESSVPESQQTVIEYGKNSKELVSEIEKRETASFESLDSDYSPHGIPRSLLLTEELDDDDSVNLVFLLDDEKEHIEDEIIYMDPSIPVPVQDDLLELDLQEGLSVVDDMDSSMKVEEVPVKPSKKQEQTNLIDRFIIANPRIEPVRDKTYHPVEDISKPFTEEKGGFITETLAKIYVTQGYYSKAIDIYEKLSLTFPEKSSYFATQIEKVKELIK